MNSFTTPELSRRLHPLSWLLATVKSLPTLIPAFAGLGLASRSTGGAWGLWIGGAIFASMFVAEIIKTRLLQWDLREQSVVVRSGLLNKDTKIIPFTRIQNVKISQNILHRILGVARVELESAGSKKPEATFDALALKQAHELSQLIQGHGPITASDGVQSGTDADADAGGQVLLHMPMGEVIRFGLVSNRGMIVLASAVALMTQFRDDAWRIVGNWLLARNQYLQHQVETAAHLPLSQLALVLVMLLIGVFVFTRVLSVLLATFTHYGYTLRDQGRRLSSERGLLSRWHDAIVKSRVQSWRIKQGWMHRLLARQTLDIDTMTGEDDTDFDESGKSRAPSHLLPIASVEKTAAILDHLAPRLQWQTRAWTRIEARNFWRRVIPAIAILTVACTAASIAIYFRADAGFRDWLWLAVAAIWVILALRFVLHSWLYFRSIAYSVDDDSFAVRTGIIGKRWHLAELRRVHVISMHRGPLDRLFGTASLLLDTAGAQRGALQMHYLPVERADALRDRLLGALNKSINN